MKMNPPVKIAKKGENNLVIHWQDGSKSDLNGYKLRISCPCASCVNEWTGDKILNVNSIDKAVRPNQIFNVGRYAMGIKWNDGHESGIYSYDYLKELS